MFCISILLCDGQWECIRTLYFPSFRNLRDARDIAILEKERAVHAEREMAGKYETLLSE